MTITALPAVPSRSDTPANFVTKADAFMAALPQFGAELNAMGTLLNLATTSTSTSSVTIGSPSGTRTFTVPAGLGYTPGMALSMAYTTTPTNNMFGTVQSYSGTTLIVNVTAVNGSGTYAAWSIALAAASAGAGFGANSFTGNQTLATGAAFRTSISTLASSATPDIWTNQSNTINYTGTVTATGFANAPQAGMSAKLVCAAAAAFVAGANMLIDGYASGQTYTAAAGDTVEVIATATTQFRLKIKRYVDFNDIQPVTCTQATGALTFTLNPTVLDIRSATLTDGVPTTVSVSSAVSMTIPSGVTLGAFSTVGASLVEVLMGNGELAVVNLGSNVDLSETGLISTNPIGQTCTFTGAIAATTGILTLSATGTGTFAIGQSLSGTNVNSGTVVKSLLTGTLGAAGSTYQTNQFTAAASTAMTGKAGIGFYSTTARTNQPYRIVGIVNVVNTAGVWGDPTLVQGSGGASLLNLACASGETYRDLTASRAVATRYYNTDKKPRTVIFRSGNNVVTTVTVDDIVILTSYTGGASSASAAVTFPVPIGSSYIINVSSGTTVSNWSEVNL